MTARTDVLDLVERWAAAEQGNDAQVCDYGTAAVANAHIGMLQEPAGRPPEPRSEL
jgi:hypothetical protein